jgi:hypothetical protein
MDKNIKLCGRDEICFTKGKEWGHLYGSMCKYLTTIRKDGVVHDFCSRKHKVVKAYLKNE